MFAKNILTTTVKIYKWYCHHLLLCRIFTIMSTLFSTKTLCNRIPICYLRYGLFFVFDGNENRTNITTDVATNPINAHAQRNI